MNITVTHYELLRVDPNADHATITAAYRRLAQRFHPDWDPSRDGHRAMVLIDAAYATLKHPDRRAEYDALLTLATPPPIDPYGEPPKPPPAAAPAEVRLPPLARRRAMARL